MTIEIMLASLDAFQPRKESENIDQLYRLLAPLAALSPSERVPAVPAMLRLIERFPEVEFGSPGPLVHELEAIPRYDDLLMDSLQRQPQPLTIWMANRILNSKLAPATREKWLEILRGVTHHPNVSETTKGLAVEFLEDQAN